jgi:hypothetical protein
VVGDQYSFTPTASDPDGDSLTFRIENLPGWLTFDQQTGRLSGIAQSAGSWGNIRISVSDGQASDSLPAFGIVAVQINSKLSTHPPRYQEWLDEMQTYGQKWGQLMDPAVTPSVGTRLGWQYYDGQWIFQQIGEYLGEAEPWVTYAGYAEQVYRDEFLKPNDYRVHGYERFPHGLLNDYLQGGDTTINDIIQVRDKPNFSNLFEFRDAYAGQCQGMSRELAYVLQANVAAEKAGQPRKTEDGVVMYESYLPWMEAHFHQWQSGGFAEYGADCGIAEAGYRFAPFMAGLNLHALIEFYNWEVDNGRDPNAYWAGNHWPDIESMVEEFLVWMYLDSTVQSGSATGQRMWVDETTEYGAFRYQDRGEGEAIAAAWELGNLIAPAYAWLGLRYAKRGSPADIDKALLYFDIGDRIFAGAAANAWIQGNGKFFNQVYRWSFKYVQWRNAARALMPQ